jgi:phenylalanyl-tRNA synthetase beta chain
MIVTRSWLQEWIDLRDISTEQIADKLNAIGLEVARVEKIEIPKNVVVGRVVACQKHPDADKLSVCEVDIGGERLQIVCGAKNAKDAQYVAVAKVGAVLPGDFRIKPAKLRGVESFGMLCSAKELGLPELEEGIMELDSSIGELELGRELASYECLADEVIEVELTPNRGDCLSVAGVARELSAALRRRLKAIEVPSVSQQRVGIGRLVHFCVTPDVESSVEYRAFEAKRFSNPLLVRLRLALLEERFKNEAEAFGYYVTHATGVITRLFGHRFFEEADATITIKKDEEGFDAVYGRQKGAIIGVRQLEISKPAGNEERFLVQTSYTDPKVITKKVHQTSLKSDWEYYRSSRGSDPRHNIAYEYMASLLHTYYPHAVFFAGAHEAIKERERPSIKVEFEQIDAILGVRIERSVMVEILKSLEFEIPALGEASMVVIPPVFRHDIENIHDVAEEIVRIYGIDRIDSRPLCFVEQNRLTDAYHRYKVLRMLRERAVGRGYFESVSFLFGHQKALDEYGFEPIRKGLELLNPITAELDTLRPSLVPNLLAQAAQNVKNGKRHIKLFEAGSFYDESRNEKSGIAFVFCGQRAPQNILTRGKPEPVDFGAMVEDMASIFGDVELKNSTPSTSLAHPYQCAEVYKEGKKIGMIYKLSLLIQQKLDLPPTYIGEFWDRAVADTYPQARPFSSYQLSFKDLSLLVKKDMRYEELKEALADLPKEVQRFFVVDLYEDESLGDKKSITIRFAIQSDEQTLTESQIGDILETILQKAAKTGATLR